MFKLVVLSVLLAFAAAKPSYVSAPIVAHSAVVGSVPTSVSHSSSSVVHSAAYAAPVVAPAYVAAHAAPAYVAAPAVVAAPALVRSAVVGSVPTSISHSSSSVVHSAAYAAPVYAAAPVIAAHAPAVVSAYAAGPVLAGHGAHLW